MGEFGDADALYAEFATRGCRVHSRSCQHALALSRIRREGLWRPPTRLRCESWV